MLDKKSLTVLLHLKEHGRVSHDNIVNTLGIDFVEKLSELSYWYKSPTEAYVEKFGESLRDREYSLTLRGTEEVEEYRRREQEGKDIRFEKWFTRSVAIAALIVSIIALLKS